MLFDTMFERATAFSAIVAFFAFSFASMKYINYMEAKSQPNSPSVSITQ